MELFGTAGIRGDARTEISPRLALDVGLALARDGDTFVVGRDGRETGPAIAAAVEAGLESGGADVVKIGQVPTPTLAFASRSRRGVMVTASHNPPHDNGLKLFVDGVEYDGTAERRIETAVAEDPHPVEWTDWGDSRHEQVLSSYRRAVVEYARDRVGDSEGLRIAVDCGNGMGSLATPQVLRELGVHVVALNANVDGHFPGRDSKPTPESLTDLRAFVADGDFDVGIGHDGDADRIVIVDERGDVVHEDTVLAILAGFYTAASGADDPVVLTTPNASGRIDEHVRHSGGRVERVRLGALHEGTANTQANAGADTDVVFAAEPWKHVHLPLGDWIDGVASAAVLSGLIATHGLEALRDPITERPYQKVSVDCSDDRKEGVMRTIETDLPEAFPNATVDTEYGVRLTFDDDSWVLVRPSGTEPYVRVYAERENIDEFVAEVVAIVERAIE